MRLLNFADILRELLDMSGVKQVQLASYLGYDVSYVSRWLNNIKVPSIKNNGELLHRIAQFIAKTSDESSKEKICAKFGYKDELSFTEYEEALFDILKTAYYLPRDIWRESTNLSISKNNCCLLELNLSLSSDNIMEAVGRAGNNSAVETVEIISIPTLEDFYKDNTEMFWKNLRNAVPEKKVIRVRHAIDIENTSQFNQIYRDIIMFYSGLPQDIVCDVYDTDDKLDNSRTLWICKDTFLTMGVPNIIAEQEHIISTSDSEIVNEYYQLMDNYFRRKPPLMRRSTYKELNNSNYFTRFLLGQDFKALFCIMPPVYMNKEQKKRITTRHSITPVRIDIQDKYDELMETRVITIYKSALIDYLVNGLLYAYGMNIVLSPEERIEHLDFLVSKLEGTNRTQLIILDDTNPVLSRSRVNASFYVNSDGMFIVKHVDERNDNPSINYCTDAKLIHGFGRFFKQFEETDSSFCLNRDYAIQFIKNATRVIISSTRK